MLQEGDVAVPEPIPSARQPMSAPSSGSTGELQRPSVRVRILRRLPIVLMVCLVALHMLLAAVEHNKRAFFPTHLIHSGYMVVVDQAHYFNGYLPLVGHSGNIDLLEKVLIDGRRGPEIKWSHPRALWEELTQGRFRKLWDSDEYKNKLPLPFFLPAMIHSVSGGSIMATSLAPQVFLILLLFSVYGVGRRAGGPWLGLAAALIASGYPGIYQLARSHHDSLATGAMAAAVICLIVYSRGFTRLWICALAGIAAYISTLVSESMAGTMLIGLIVAGPFAMEYVRLIRRCRSRKVDVLWGMAGLALFLAPMCLLFNWDRISLFISYGQHSWAESDSYAFVGSHVPESLKAMVAFLAYFIRIPVDILRPTMTLWLVAGAVLLWRAPRGERLTVALWVAVPLVLQTVMPKKATQYIVPICPGLALVTALGLRGLKSPRRRRWAIGLAAGCGLMMPLFFSLVPRHYRGLVDLDQISPLIKETVKIYELPLGDENDGLPLLHHTDLLPLARAGRELVAYDLENNSRVAGPRRVALFGGYNQMNESFRYVVELDHPRMFVLDLLGFNMVRTTRQLMLDELKADQFDYLIFVGNVPNSGLQEFPSDQWDPLKSRTDLSPILRAGDGLSIRPDEKSLMMMDGQSLPDQKRWNARFRRFTKDLLKRRWKRVNLSEGPVYQAVERAQIQLPPPNSQ